MKTPGTGQTARGVGVPIDVEAREALRRHVLEPLVPRIVDSSSGGFFVDLDERWRPAGPQEKSLEHQTRTTIAFALLDRAFPGEGLDAIARHGCAFLKSAMWDDAHGGFFARVDRGGRPLWDGMKHPHATNYAARAFLLSAPLLAPGEGGVWADRARCWLEDVAWDEEHGGIWGSYRRNNELYSEGERLPTPDGGDVFGLSPGFKEINSQGDAIEMLATFHEEGALGRRSQEKLAWLVEHVMRRLIDSYGVLPYLYRRDWRPAPDLARIGYQFLMARHLLAAGTALPALATETASRARDLVDFCLAMARHPRGGFSFAVSASGRAWPGLGPSSDLQQWWVQLEGIYALHLLAGLPALDPGERNRYRASRDELWGFLRECYFDTVHGGIRELPQAGQAVGPAASRRLAGVRDRDSLWRPWIRHLLRRGIDRARTPFPATPSSGPMKSHAWKDVSHEVATFLGLGHGSADGP